MNKRFRPMKPAAIVEADLDSLTYPIIGQPKLDGIRCVIKDGKALTYSLKPIPNDFIRESLEARWIMSDFIYDGELLLINMFATFQEIQSAVMSKEGKPEFRYVVFDKLSFLNFPYKQRVSLMGEICYFMSHIRSTPLNNKSEVLLFEKEMLAQMYEGIILRSPNGLYKFGRSTKKEQYLLKLKRFVDAEAKIIGFNRLYINENRAETNAHGLTERSTKQDYLVSTNMIGSFIVEGINGKYKGKTFNVGSGFTNEQRKDYWNRRPSFLEKILTYKYQEIGSTDNAPRQPIFKSFRDNLDI